MYLISHYKAEKVITQPCEGSDRKKSIPLLYLLNQFKHKVLSQSRPQRLRGRGTSWPGSSCPAASTVR